MTPRELPDDPAALKTLVADLDARLVEMDRALEEQAREIAERDRRIEQLKHQLLLHLRARFGRRSEKLDPNQLDLFREILSDGGASAEEAAEEVIEVVRRKVGRKGHGRQKLPPELPRERIEYEVAEHERTCPTCKREMEKIGEEVSEQLEYVPASFVVKQHVRPKYACRSCGDKVVTAEKPPQPIEKGLPGPGLLAQVVVSKYADHLPLYRQERIYRRHGVELSRSTLCEWVREAAEILAPIHAKMKERVLESEKIHTDDVPVPVLDGDRDETREARLWVYVGDEEHPHTVFDYTANRTRDGPVKFLGGWHGYLQADAYGGYDGIYAGGKVIEVACWAHARRKFYDAQESDPGRSRWMLGRIARLYAVEEEARTLGREGRKSLRGQRSRAILAEIETWLGEQEGRVLPKSPIGQAVGYARNQWRALRRYVEDGILEADNNIAERAVRGVAVGRKNWLFAGSDEGGKRAAILFSLVETCKAHAVDPFAYLRDVIARIATHPAKRIEELLVPAWKAAHATTAATA